MILGQTFLIERLSLVINQPSPLVEILTHIIYMDAHEVETVIARLPMLVDDRDIGNKTSCDRDDAYGA